MKIKSILFYAAIVFVITSCSNSPENVAEKFYTALNKKDYDAAAKVCTERTKTMMSFAQNMAENTNKKNNFENAEIKNIDCEVEGEKAACICFLINENKKEKQEDIDLVKTEDGWKVDIAKQGGNENLKQIIRERNSKKESNKDLQESDTDLQEGDSNMENLTPEEKEKMEKAAEAAADSIMKEAEKAMRNN